MSESAEEDTSADDASACEALAGEVDAARGRPARRIALGPVSVPALAWFLSVALHTAAAAAALLMIRSWSPPRILLSRGDPAGVQWGMDAQGGPGPEGAMPAVVAAIPDAPLVTEPPAPPAEFSLEIADVPIALMSIDSGSPTSIQLDHGVAAHVAEAFPESAERGAAPRLIARPPAGGSGDGDGPAGATGGNVGGTEAHPGTATSAGSGEGTGTARSGIAGGLDRHSIPQPIYPRESQHRGEQGQVVLEVEVRADGSIGEVRIVKDSGFPRLAQAAIDAVRSAYIEPAREDGRAVASRVSIPFNFVLKSAKPR